MKGILSTVVNDEENKLISVGVKLENKLKKREQDEPITKRPKRMICWHLSLQYETWLIKLSSSSFFTGGAVGGGKQQTREGENAE